MKSLLIIFLGLLTASNVSAGEPVNKGGVKRDTIQAVVQYGEEILFDALEGLTDGQVGDLRDSVLKYHGANELTNYINLYLSLKSKTEVQLNEYIDSLFEAGGDVPYALINQINIYLARQTRGFRRDRA